MVALVLLGGSWAFADDYSFNASDWAYTGDGGRIAQANISVDGNVITLANVSGDNNAALKYAPIAPDFFAQLGESMYIRMTIKELGELGNFSPDGCCSNCGDSRWPKFQVGVVYDRLCVDKARWTKYCNCDTGFCSEGCVR